MSKKKIDQSSAPRQGEQKPARRKVLKTIAAGGGAVALGKSLPEQWSKPVVDSVLVPAHAQATPGPQRSVVLVELQQASSLLDFFVGTANAAAPCVPPTAFCVDRDGNTVTYNIDGFTQTAPANDSTVTVGPFQLVGVVITPTRIDGFINCTYGSKKEDIGFGGDFVPGTCASVI